MVSRKIVHCDLTFLFYSTLLIGNTKKAKEIGSKYFLLMSLLHLQPSQLASSMCNSVFYYLAKASFIVKRVFHQRLSKKGRKHLHSVIKLPNFRCISKQKWHRKLTFFRTKGNPYCILFFSLEASVSFAVSPACLLFVPTFVLYQMSSFENGSGNPRCCC